MIPETNGESPVYRLLVCNRDTCFEGTDIQDRHRAPKMYEPEDFSPYPNQSIL